MPPNTAQLYIAENLYRRQVNAALEQLPAAMLMGSKTYDPPSIGDAAQATTTVTVTGAVLGDFCLAPSFSLDTGGLVLSGQVTASDTVTVTMRNDTGAPIDLDSGTLAAAVLVF